jgi:hypothetical protein
MATHLRGGRVLIVGGYDHAFTEARLYRRSR